MASLVGSAFSSTTSFSLSGAAIIMICSPTALSRTSVSTVSSSSSSLDGEALISVDFAVSEAFESFTDSLECLSSFDSLEVLSAETVVDVVSEITIFVCNKEVASEVS